jgi:hypothetical protein
LAQFDCLSLRALLQRSFSSRLYPLRGTSEAIREQSRQRFGRSRAAIERQRQLPL